MSTFLPLDHSSTKIRHNRHSKTIRWEVGMTYLGILHKEMGILHKEMGILQKEVGILQKEVGILHEEVGILEHDLKWESFRRRWNPSQGGGNPSPGGGNPSQGGHNSSQGGWGLSQGGGIFQWEEERLTTLSLKESFTRRWNPSQGGLKKFKNKKEETSIPSVSLLIRSPIQVLNGPSTDWTLSHRSCPRFCHLTNEFYENTSQ